MKIKLTIEAGDGVLWGLAQFDGNTILEEAPTQEVLISRMKHLITEFHGIFPDEYTFDISHESPID